ETDLYHFPRPLSIMVAATARLAETMLPLVHHLVHERRNDFAVRSFAKRRRIERDFVHDLALSLAVAELLAGKVAPAASRPLHGDQAIRQLVLEQHAVEVVVRRVEVGVGFLGRAQEFIEIMFKIIIVVILYRTIHDCLPWRSGRSSIHDLATFRIPPCSSMTVTPSGLLTEMSGTQLQPAPR